MEYQAPVLFGASAIACALVGGYFLGAFLLSIRREAAYKRSVAGIARPSYVRGAKAEDKGVNARVIAYMKRANARKPRFQMAGKKHRSEEIEKLLRLTGLEGQVTPQAFYETRATMFFAGALSGALAGMAFSIELACILALTGAFIGFQFPKHALKARIARRACDTERHLPEMLDVVALCMRSGLSIDASIAIYAKHFDTVLANELESARRKWTSGLERRDEALRKLAATYDSIVLGRVVDTIIRSVRFGSSMVANLESDADEARSAFRASREERIAKAPVKMMIPTGVLILPAMLIMVLGPVLLELMEGGV